MTGTLDNAAARRWLTLATERLEAATGDLTALDAAIGDGDHGTNLQRGFRAVRDRVLANPPATLTEVLKATGMTLLSTVGGAAGPLYGTFFLRLATATAAEPAPDGVQLAAVLRAGVDGVRQRGKAELGDKTMVDALLPALDAADAAVARGEAAPVVLASAASAAEDAAVATTGLVARKGRASYLGERSAGHRDPGATSSAILLRALADAVATP
ncbi:MAG: dihydroxyacetone kinase subunit DhaL [Candidatus Dormiibacterota bacterium]